MVSFATLRAVARLGQSAPAQYVDRFCWTMPPLDCPVNGISSRFHIWRKDTMTGSPQYTATLLDPCVANRASVLEKIDVTASTNAKRRAIIARKEGDSAARSDSIAREQQQ